MGVYPQNWTKNYVIAYGILGQVSDVDTDKVYDYHTSFNVDINANQKKILNIVLDRNSDNSAATVEMVKDIIPFTKNNLYGEFFEEIYDFSDVRNYKITIGASGVTFTEVNPNVSFPTKDLSIILHNGPRVKNYILNLDASVVNFTLCIVISLWLNINVSIEGYMTTTNKIVELKFDKTTNKLILNNLPRISITIPNSFSGKEVVLWLTKYRSSSTNNETIKASISNYSATLTLSLHHSFVTRKDFFEITSEDIYHH